MADFRRGLEAQRHTPGGPHLVEAAQALLQRRHPFPDARRAGEARRADRLRQRSARAGRLDISGMRTTPADPQTGRDTVRAGAGPRRFAMMATGSNSCASRGRPSFRGWKPTRSHPTTRTEGDPREGSGIRAPDARAIVRPAARCQPCAPSRRTASRYTARASRSPTTTTSMTSTAPLSLTR